MFTYSCSSSGLSSFYSAPEAVVAVSAVGVSANASWSPFVAVVLTWLMARSKGKIVFHKGETDVCTPGAAFATFGADRGSWSCLN